jgi:hypothetical protein
MDNSSTERDSRCAGIAVSGNDSKLRASRHFLAEAPHRLSSVARLAPAAPLIHASGADVRVGGAWNPLCDIRSSTTLRAAWMSVADACGGVR